MWKHPAIKLLYIPSALAFSAIAFGLAATDVISSSAQPIVRAVAFWLAVVAVLDLAIHHIWYWPLRLYKHLSNSETRASHRLQQIGQRVGPNMVLYAGGALVLLGLLFPDFEVGDSVRGTSVISRRSVFFPPSQAARYEALFNRPYAGSTREIPARAEYDRVIAESLGIGIAAALIFLGLSNRLIPASREENVPTPRTSPHPNSTN